MRSSKHFSLSAVAGIVAVIHAALLPCASASAADPAAQTWPDGSAKLNLQPKRSEDVYVPYVPSIAQPSASAAARGPATRTAPRPASAGVVTAADRRAPPREYKSGVYALNTDYWLGYPRSVLQIATAPARFDGKDWMIAAGVVAAGGALFALDRGIRDYWQDNIRGSTSEDVSKVFDPFGNTNYALGALFGAYAVSEALDQTNLYPARRAKAASLLALESVLISSGITTGIKYVTGRKRPNKAESQFQFDGPGNGFNRAFPSGHATTAFAVASSVSEVYGDDYPWVPWVLYSFATGTALSRIDRNKHWASDVFAGAAIGYFVGKVVTRLNPFLEEQNLSLRPFVDTGEYGSAIVHRF